MVFTHKKSKKSIIKKCRVLSDFYLKQAVLFKELGLSIEQNKATVDIEKFIDKRIKSMEMLTEWGHYTLRRSWKENVLIATKKWSILKGIGTAKADFL